MKSDQGVSCAIFIKVHIYIYNSTGKELVLRFDRLQNADHILILQVFAV